MKYITILGDGWSDFPDERGNTPLSDAKKPNIDRIAALSSYGLCKTVPDGMKPGSDIANMSVMGYNPAQYYTGRSPLEAASMGIELGADDVSYRCNLVTLGGSGDYPDLFMDDYSAGEIETKDAAEFIDELKKSYAFPEGVELYAGVSYRHCLVIRNGRTGAKLTPPHDISGRPVSGYLPSGQNAELIMNFMAASREIFAKSKLNKARILAGKKPVSSAWLWGEGTRPSFKSFYDIYGLKGAVISAVDLVKGLGKVAGMASIDVPGATGNLHTNFSGKAQAAVDALDKYDYVYLHIEAPDECGHQGDREGKVKAIELIDGLVVGPVLDALAKKGIAFRMLVTPDHPTPITLRTHTSDPVPFFIYDSTKTSNGISSYTENNCGKGMTVDSGEKLLELFVGVSR